MKALAYQHAERWPTEGMDALRLRVNDELDPKNKNRLGQFMTPTQIARFMANLFGPVTEPVTLLDCGAGIGSLTVAAVNTLKKVAAIEVWEIDEIMCRYLRTTLDTLKVPYELHASDFIYDAVVNVATGQGTRFTHAILNPPYKKIASESAHRALLRKVRVETVNLYTAFLALTIMLMNQGGQVVAIVPRSFCNGPYYRPFRSLLLYRCRIEHIHVFKSRNKAFKDDDVLQENVIFKLGVGLPQGTVKVSCSHDQTLSDYAVREVPFTKIVKPDDQETFIHIPMETNGDLAHGLFDCTLADVGVMVSTGPVVDFRLKDFWLPQPTLHSVPLIYAHHFVRGELKHPVEHKKPNALRKDPKVAKWLMPRGTYVLVRRFSAKEERRRIVAYVFDKESMLASEVGFENHLNVFHSRKKGLDSVLARGLACFLNSTEADEHFRVFSGHTQVNATDLRNMRYPRESSLRRLGCGYKPGMSQEETDALVETIR